jgi:hypothetical protein
VPYVPVPAALVGRREDPQCLRAGAFGGLQPGPPGAMALDVAGRLCDAYLRQPGALAPERRQLAARRLELPVPVPPGADGLPQVSLRLAPRPRLGGHVGLAVPRGAVADGGCLRRPVTLRLVVAVKSAIEPAHSKSMRPQ